jgi:hypothetical protein
MSVAVANCKRGNASAWAKGASCRPLHGIDLCTARAHFAKAIFLKPNASNLLVGVLRGLSYLQATLCQNTLQIKWTFASLDGVTPNKLGSGGSWERVWYPAFGAPVLFCGHVPLRVCSCVVGVWVPLCEAHFEPYFARLWSFLSRVGALAFPAAPASFKAGALAYFVVPALLEAGAFASSAVPALL